MTDIQTRMREATRLTMSGQLQKATALIQQALGHASSANTSAKANEDPFVLDGLVFEVPARPTAPAQPTNRSEKAGQPEQSHQARFTTATHSHAGLMRQYKLFVPPGHVGKSLPLVVMLHGCKQNPDDFAAGTAMNERAMEQGFFVLYPAQAQDANPSRCWNWFKHTHQHRGRGEPALIADLTQSVIKQYNIDPNRVYVAGLSAGGAMATIVAQAYPEIFAAVGVHSGLPSGEATNLQEALALMQSGAAAKRPTNSTVQPLLVPTIVFHGDKDQTVHPRNGDQIIAGIAGSKASSPNVERGRSPNGRNYTRSVYRDADGGNVAEHWIVHGAGHAWAGGQASGSYTDGKGPDATREMLRFFFENPRTAQHRGRA